MPNLWDDRINGPVRDAILNGIVLYVADGEIHPGKGIPEDLSDSVNKPIGLPVWHVYQRETAKPPRPCLRFLQLLHKPRNPFGAQVQNYLEKGLDALGFPLCVPLGEGPNTPPEEAGLTKTFLASVLFQPVKVIGLGRTRLVDGHAVADAILLEVYSQDGATLIWRHPHLGLDGSLAAMATAPYLAETKARHRTPRGVRVPNPVLNEEISPKIAAKAVSTGRLDMTSMFEGLLAGGMDKQGVAEAASRSTGIPLPIIQKALNKHLNTIVVPEEVAAAVEGALSAGLEGEELIEAVMETCPDVTREVVLAAYRPASAPKEAALPTLSMKSLDGEETDQASGDGVVATVQKKAKAPRPKRSTTVRGNIFTKLSAPNNPAGAEGGFGSLEVLPPKLMNLGNADPETVSRAIAENSVAYQQAVLRILAVKTLGAGELRAALNIPEGSTKASGLKLVSDSFRRNVTEKLLKRGAIVKVGGENSPRTMKYSIPRQ